MESLIATLVGLRPFKEGPREKHPSPPASSRGSGERRRTIPLAEALQPLEKIGDVKIIDLGGGAGAALANGGANGVNGTGAMSRGGADGLGGRAAGLPPRAR